MDLIGGHEMYQIPCSKYVHSIQQLKNSKMSELIFKPNIDVI
jgi:hypothetical protein